VARHQLLESPRHIYPQGVFNDYSNGPFPIWRVQNRAARRRTGTPQCLLFTFDLGNRIFSLPAAANGANIFDVHYAGDYSGWDWDLETMVQTEASAPNGRAWAWER